MKILITGANHAKALKLLKAFPNHFVVMGDYGDVPSIHTEHYTFASFGAFNKDSIAHIFLNFCITESIDCIIPLNTFEFEPMAKSAVLFSEYDIQVLLPEAEILKNYIDVSAQTTTDFAVFIHGDLLFATQNVDEHLITPELNGVFKLGTSAENLKLFSI
ncbi:hypothetical protein ACJVDH_05425 [Pedobacter sp. AW1-32]|uniref:hypothetical protein n=1 Tax=Pedobacter sp. AW1-32 TaxID=3383026 RepID=UPI003FEFF8A2